MQIPWKGLKPSDDDGDGGYDGYDDDDGVKSKS